MLVIVADDYGYANPYDEGILAAVHAQAVDAVSAMVRHRLDPTPLLRACAAAEVEIGLHLEVPSALGLQDELAAFERLFARAPAYLDGHHHCHARPGVAKEAARAAVELGVPVRSVDALHRELLRSHGVKTADRLVGRLAESDPELPNEVSALVAGEEPEGVTEWMVHPGRAGGPSSYDAGRERDLELLLRLGDRRSWRARGVLRAPPSRARLA